MLAEKYRPHKFSQVIGQQKVINGMRWHLDHVDGSGLCFLVTGPTGSGKTTLAECAARYWGVNDFDIHKVESAECDVARLRELASKMLYYGIGDKGRKLYVIDEIHTVTGRAADRLLSLLESVPKHVLIVGTTTESDWTDGILLSRWIQFDLAKVRAGDVARYLESIAESEGLPIPSDPTWATKLVKYHGLNMRDQLNQLPERLLSQAPVAA